MLMSLPYVYYWETEVNITPKEIQVKLFLVALLFQLWTHYPVFGDNVPLKAALLQTTITVYHA